MALRLYWQLLKAKHVCKSNRLSEAGYIKGRKNMPTDIVQKFWFARLALLYINCSVAAGIESNCHD